MFEVACLLAVFSVPIAIVIALSCMDDARCEKATSVLLAVHAPVLLCFMIFALPHPSGRIATGLLAAATGATFGITPTLAIFSAARVKRFKKLAGYVVFLTTVDFLVCFLSLGSMREAFDNAALGNAAFVLYFFSGFTVLPIVAATAFSPFVALARLEDAVCEKTTTALLSANALFLLLLVSERESPFLLTLEIFGSAAFYEFFAAPILVVFSVVRLRRFKTFAGVLLILIVINAAFWFPVMNVLLYMT